MVWSQASPRLYLHAWCLAFCEGPGMLRLVPAPKNKYMYIRSIYGLISDVGIRKKIYRHKRVAISNPCSTALTVLITCQSLQICQSRGCYSRRITVVICLDHSELELIKLCMRTFPSALRAGQTLPRGSPHVQSFPKMVPTHVESFMETVLKHKNRIYR